MIDCSMAYNFMAWRSPLIAFISRVIVIWKSFAHVRLLREQTHLGPQRASKRLCVARWKVELSLGATVKISIVATPQIHVYVLLLNQLNSENRAGKGDSENM